MEGEIQQWVMNNRARHRFADVATNGARGPRTARGHEFRADDSRINSFVAVVTGGEGNHSWHDADAACPRHGRRVAMDAEALAAGAKRERGWRPDATWRLVQILAMLGLIYKVKRPR
jgi:fatty-acid desaturase